MKPKELLAVGICFIFILEPVLEGLDGKPYRKAPPHTDNKLPLAELPTDDIPVANGTITQQGSEFYDYNSIIQWPSSVDGSKS